MIQPNICRTTAKKKSRRRAAIFSRAYSISAALIFRAAVSFVCTTTLNHVDMAALGGSRHEL